MINSIRLSNFLSFGNDSEEILLNPLNIVIGTNGSGKSNFLEAFDDWLYKGDNKQDNAVIDVVVKNNLLNPEYDELSYIIEFNAVGQRFEIVDEKIFRVDINEYRMPVLPPYFFYNNTNGISTINTNELQIVEDIDTTQSILAQKRDARHYPEITQLAHDFSKIKMYREWNFGRYTPARLHQKADLPNNYLESDCGNLGLVLNQIRMYPSSKNRLLKELQLFYADVEDYDVSIVSNTVQIVFHERGLNSSVPATRLSDGTLRYLCLLAILCHPSPPPLICIEEPELGLHPDVLPNLAKLLRDASERSQIVVTTHSDILVDAFTDNPEAVLVAEKNDTGTHLTRLDSQQLKPWLEKYSLGQLWNRGDIGGSRW